MTESLPKETRLDELKNRNRLDVLDIPEYDFNFIEVKGSLLKERADEYLKFSKILVGTLPENERDKFIVHPVEFTSDTFLFRGFSSEEYNSLQKRGYYKPYSGEFGEEGVFLSNRPAAAFGFTQSWNGVIAVINRDKLILKDKDAGILETGSELYKKKTKELLNSLSQRPDVNVLYLLDSIWDISKKESSSSTSARTFVLRLPQPISITKTFIILNASGVSEETPHPQS